ncbi:MAG: uracil-DNA glycosylase [Holosporales bacterium]|jgi:DNA polymerase|nr:uracil-DNA glycosylase [Holosporales bacterium]
MTEEHRLRINALSRWYKTFGVDHVFRDINSNEKWQKKQEQKANTSTVYSSSQLCYDSIEELEKAVREIDCHLKKTAKRTVFSDGNPGSDVMIIGEAPGQEEDEQGKPFVGESGKLLNNMLLSVGIKRSDVYISNIVFWRPQGNRAPSTDEIALCMPYVENHVRLVNPRILLLLGGIAVKSILNTDAPISKLRGSKSAYMGIDTIVTFHPAYLLRSPGQKYLVFRDFILLKRLLLSKDI